MVHIMRALPSQHMFGSFGQNPLKSHTCNNRSDLIRINQTGITENLGSLSKNLFDLRTHSGNFFTETFFISQRRKPMRIRFAQKFATTCVIQLMQQVYHSGRIDLQLFQSHTRNRKSDFKSSSVILYHFKQSGQCRNIRTLCNLRDTAFIFIIIIIVMIRTDIETTIAFQMYDLMYFKIKTDCFHI